MLTYTGKNPSILAMTEDDIDIIDISHGLSMENRFNGQTYFPYSVAQHSIYVADLLPDDQKLAGLLHDGSEAYVKDIPWELKPLIKKMYGPIEKRIQDLIYKKYNVDDIDHDLIKHIDTSVAWHETKALFRPKCLEWFEDHNVWHINKGLNIDIEYWDWEKADILFCNYFELLTKGLKQ